MQRVIQIKLFSLQPIGIKTSMIESLTSYLARLAEEHCVTVGTLIGKVVAEELGKEYLLKSSKHGGSRFYEQGGSFNGLGRQSEDMSTALYNLTGRDTSRLTLQYWRDLLPATDLLRKYKAWCPICLDEWKKRQQPIYEPLIWIFKAIKTCEIHNVHLEIRCPLCDAEIPILNRNTRNGYCSFCGCWLGQNAHYINKESAHSSWDHFVFSNVGDLLLNGSSLPINYFIVFIEHLISATGGVITVSRYFDVSKSTVSEWHNGIHKPSLNMILKLCYSLKLNVLDLSQPFTLPDKNKSERMANSIQKHQRRRIDWNHIEATLKDIISHCEFYTPSVREVARKLDIDKRLLYYHFPLLCNAITKNYTSQIELMKSKRLEEGCNQIRVAVKNAYDAGEYPSRRIIEDTLPSSMTLREQIFKDYWKSLI